MSELEKTNGKRYNVTVSVPYKKKMPYTLFAGGVKTSVQTDKNEDFLLIKFLGGTVFYLLYTFRDFRRGYLVTGWKNEDDGDAVALPGVNEKLCVILEAKGRKVDHLKRSIYLLTKQNEDKVFRFPLVFWYKTAALIEYSGAKKSDLMFLYNKFNKENEE